MPKASKGNKREPQDPGEPPKNAVVLPPVTLYKDLATMMGEIATGRREAGDHPQDLFDAAFQALEHRRTTGGAGVNVGENPDELSPFVASHTICSHLMRCKNPGCQFPCHDEVKAYVAGSTHILPRRNNRHRDHPYSH